MCTFVNWPNKRVEEECVLHLLLVKFKPCSVELYIEKGEGKGGCLGGKDFLFMMVSIFACISFSP